MKNFYLSTMIIAFVIVVSGCVGFWTVVGTMVYMNTDKHQTVTVQLKSKPDKVYAAMLRVAEKNHIDIKKADETKFMVEGTKDIRSASVYVEDVGNGLSQLIVTVDVDVKKKERQKLALEIVNNICSEIGETCEMQK